MKSTLTGKILPWIVGIGAVALMVYTTISIITNPEVTYNTCEVVTMNLTPIFVVGMMIGATIVIIPYWCIDYFNK
jgi:hypothetical protein